MGTAQLLSGIVGMTLGGWLGDRFGAKKSTLAIVSMFRLVSALHLVGLGLMLVVKFPRRSLIEQQVAAQLPEKLGPEPSHN